MKNIYPRLYALIFGLLMLISSANAQIGCSATISDSIMPGTTTCSFAANGPVSGHSAYWWNFGDNSTQDYGQTVAHTYSSLGTYIVTLNVVDTPLSCSFYVYDTITLSSSSSCSNYTSINDTYSDSSFLLSAQNTGTPPFTYYWYLPGGATSTLPEPVCSLGSLSSATIVVFVTDANGCVDSSSATLSDSGEVISPCAMSISVTQTDSFVSLVPVNTGIGPFTYLWYLPGNVNSFLPSPSFILSDTGSYTILGVVQDSTGCIDTAFVILTDSLYYTSPLPPCATTIVSTNIDSLFTLMTQNVGMGPFTFLWTLPDGSVSTLPDPTYTIGASGSYFVEVVVTDSLGCRDTAFTTLSDSLQNTPPCQAYFVVVPDSATGDYTAIDYSSGPGSLSYLWSFGDGSTSILQFPTHVYSTPGYYTICLTIYDSSNNCTSTYCDSAFYAFKNSGGPMSQLTVQGSPAGINPVNAETAFSIYPNPARSTLDIRVSNGLIIQSSIVYTITGQKVAEFGGEAELNISALEPGMYFIKTETNVGCFRTSFVRQD